MNSHTPKTTKKMRKLFIQKLITLTLLLTSFSPAYTQDGANSFGRPRGTGRPNIRPINKEKARKEAEKYWNLANNCRKKAERYDSIANDYTQKAQEYMQMADYYSQNENTDSANIYVQKANRATEEAHYYICQRNLVRERVREYSDLYIEAHSAAYGTDDGKYYRYHNRRRLNY